MLALLSWAAATQAQEPSTVPPPTASSTEQQPAQAIAPGTCVQPAPMVSLSDYRGPLEKTVGIFSRRLERKAVHPPHYMPGAKLCTLGLKDKFVLFAQNTIDPVTFISAGFDSGISQAENDDPSYGQGLAGYGHRFGANLIGQASSDFFKDFAYPSIFAEDPRYYRLIHGRTRTRLLHALEHSVVGYREDGTQMFNFSEWLGTTSAIALSNTYHPDNRRGFSPSAERVGYAVANDAAFDVLREFWPEIARKFNLPFRDQHEP
ncbi:MAG TPA: hypothetical protein VN822_03940 [Candidatus Acidoferrales bacterium]|nr:hypothetical protein [Candidatus Acidoferrales bacterium]